MIFSAKGTFGSVPAVEDLNGFHTEGGTVQEEKHRVFAFKWPRLNRK